MNRSSILILKSLNKIYTNVTSTNNFGYTDELVDMTDKEAYDLLIKKLTNDKPAMICRFGNVELNCLLHYYSINKKNSLISKTFNYVKGKTFPFWWDEAIFKFMENNAGFINANEKNLKCFSERMIEDMAYVDVLGSWMKGEKYFEKYMKNAIKIKIRLLAPWNYKEPWTEALSNKKVLVIHPYEKSIKNQFLNRGFLFNDNRMLPPFELDTIKAVQSIAQNKTKFDDWFDALHYMEDIISSKNFDIAILGCGAYGFPLAAFIKRMGKKAINLGGATQILFGIKGKRWENHYPENSFFNKYWSNPLPEEIPANYKKVEGGCYW